MKGQIFYDNIDSFKDSYLPYGENQYIKAIESKFTVTKRISDDNLPDWVRINMLGSLNYRETAGWIKSSGGDFDWRQDINFNGGYHYANTRFWTQLTNPDYVTGAADTSFRSSKFDSTGLGVMFDIDLFTNWNFVIGGRYDTSDASATDMPSFNANTGRSPAAGVVCTAPGHGLPGRVADDTDHRGGHRRRRLVELQRLAADRRPLAPVRDRRRIEPAAIDRRTTRCKSRSFAPATSAKPSSRRPASRRRSSTRSCNGRARPTARRAPT